MFKIAVACDPNAEEMKQIIIEVCRSLGHGVIDFGGKDPIYANVAIKVAEYVVSKKADRGILICGTGIGMCIAANKVNGAYAALITNVYSAERAIKSNNSNIACLGAFTLGEKLAEQLITKWLSCEYVMGSPSEPKIQRIKEYEYQNEFLHSN